MPTSNCTHRECSGKLNRNQGESVALGLQAGGVHYPGLDRWHWQREGLTEVKTMSACRIAARCAILGAALLCIQPVSAVSSERTVAELFTSLGCSSCPPADALAGRLSANPDVIVLSFHVNYWDSPQWKDPFSSEVATDRQHNYALRSGQETFTPQLILNGTQSFIGSQESEIQDAITATHVALPAQVDLSRQADGTFLLTLSGTAKGADVWAIDYVRHSATQVRGGENSGRRLDTYKDVTQIRRLGAFAVGTMQLPALKAPADGLAVLVQTHRLGPILGAGAYETK